MTFVRRYPLLAAVVATLAVPLAAASALVAFQERADRAQEAEDLIVRVDALVHRLDTLQWEAAAEGPEGDVLPADILAARMRVRDALAALERAAPRAAGGRELAGAFIRYDRAVSREVRLAAAGPVPTSARADEQQVDAAYAALTQQLVASKARMHADRTEVIRNSRIASAGVLLLAFLLIAALAALAARARADAAAARAEGRALRSSEERFRALVQNASDVIAIVDGDGLVTYASPSAQRILGYSDDDLVGRRLSDLFVDDARRAVDALLADAAAAPATDVRVTVSLNTGAAPRDLEVVASDHTDDEPIRGVIVTLRDLTSLRSSDDELRRLRARVA